MLAWLSVWSETCMWPSWCHCHSLSLASVKSRLVLLFWYRLTRVVPEKGLLNLCVCVRACVRVCACALTCVCVRERTELTYLCAWGFGWTVCRQARWNDGQSVWRMIRQTLWQTSASEADILERWERPHLCCTPIHSGSLYLSLYLLLTPQSQTFVWDQSLRPN